MNPAELDDSYETDEIRAYLADCHELGMVNDLERWYVTEEWAAKFRSHRQKLLILAKPGNPWAQCHVAGLYVLGSCYTSYAEFEKNYERDAVEMTNWLVRAARQGIVMALDPLVMVGVGPEAERVRAIFNELYEQVPDKRCLPLRET
ncbi:MAG: hypothetical protein ACXWUF_08525 [Methylomagnum sp.]